MSSAVVSGLFGLSLYGLYGWYAQHNANLQRSAEALAKHQEASWLADEPEWCC